MLWSDLLARFPALASGGIGNPDITDVTCDSRTVIPGSLYVSIPGFKRHGDEFVAPAIAQGAIAVFSENPQPKCDVPWARIGNTRKALGPASSYVWNIDASSMLVVGITGTNGKTTTAFLFHRLFSELFGPGLAWMFGTVAYSLGDKLLPASTTTPQSSEIFRAIAHAPKPPKAVVMEVSSHALALDRVAGLTYDCAIWTNLTQDHLDFHKTMEDYYQAKKLLFTGYIKKGGRAVINIDDPWGKRLAGELPHIEIATYGWSEGARVRIVEGVSSPNGTDITLQTEAGRLHFSSKLSGHFNIYNMTALVTGALSLSINVKVIERCFQTMETVPGRMERVPLSAGYSVFVDYAHTPDALVNVLSTARNFTQGRLVCVFGCGGDRDKTKRPLMAEAVTQHCDEAIITSDNPRGENPLSIMRDIVQGIPLDFPHVTIADRREAIRKAIREARPGDCIIVAGKGHEDYQEIKGVRRHFDDRETVVELFAELERSHA